MIDQRLRYEEIVLDAEPDVVDTPKPATPHVRVAREFMCTDTGNAERFVAMHGRDVRFCPQWSKWLVWDGTRWAPDVRGAAMALTKDVVRSIYREAASSDDEERRKRFASWALKSESKNARQSMLQLAQCEPGIAVTPDELDRDPWLLNTPSGTIDLRTGLMREHSREDLITKRTAAAFGVEKNATWERVIDDAVAGDGDVAAFLQRAAGYSITGLTTEEKLFVLHGPAGSGKSTIVQAIVCALGEYAKTADFEAFLQQKNGGGPRNDIARLAGSRFVASIEVDKGKRLAEGLVKTLTGGDAVTARFLYQEAFEFRPTFTLWLVVNDAPQVRDDDTGMWRRIVRVPLEHVVPPERRDPAVKAELIDVARAGPAIIRWLVEGCVFWQAHGLKEPTAVQAATEEYRHEQDPLRDFVTECCQLEPHSTCTRSALRNAYESWVDEAGGRNPLTGRNFNERIRALSGVGERVVNGVRGWTGIRLQGVAVYAPRGSSGEVAD